ncbi:MAG: hypothetical protein RR959_07935 [Erysipelotrichaceae bacterium]
MKTLTKFKVERNYLVYSDYKIRIIPFHNFSEGNYLKFVVHYKDKEIFSANEKDTLEDIIETIFELEKDDQEYKDQEAFNKTLHKIIGRGYD